MIENFNSRFDAAFDMRLYQHAKGYTDVSSDAWEYWVWEPQDVIDACDDNELDSDTEKEVGEF